jgi:hypothetical protein
MFPRVRPAAALVALAAVLTAAALPAATLPAHAGDKGGSIDSTIRAVVPAKRLAILGDGSHVTLGPAVDPATLAPGQKVRILAETDEDGIRPATGAIRLN